MKNKKVLVTGACGFIGSHLTEYLVLKGYDVVAFDKYNRDNHHGCASGKGLVFLANELDIKTCEIQHAYMGKSHEGFAYPKLKSPLIILKPPISIFSPITPVCSINFSETVVFL